MTEPLFDGRRYENPGHSAVRSFRDLLKWQLTAHAQPWPAWIDHQPPAALPTQVSAGEAAITFVNHATFLIQTPELTFLTDPVWSERASPLRFAGPRRVHAPGVPIEQLPRVDVVLVSHNHYDHMDLDTLRRLEDRDRPRFVTSKGNRAFLQARGLPRVDELTWWQSLTLERARVTMTPAQHFSARTPFDRNRTLWGGFVLEGTGPRVFFAADTGYWRHFIEVREHFERIDVALLPIGAYEPRWFMRPAHMDPEEAVQAHLDLDARLSVAMHFGTFRLTDEAWDEPPRRLRQALETRGVPPERFRVLRPGETLVITRADSV